MKYAIIIPDGAADEPLKELGGKTPLAVAKTPFMDEVAMSGRIGTARTVPAGFESGSDVATMSLLGYDPVKYHTGRAPLEAAAKDIPLSADDMVFRLNLVTAVDGVMKDHSAGGITDAEAAVLLAALHDELKSAGLMEGFEIHQGVSYRNLLVKRGLPHWKLTTKPPHEIPEEKIEKWLPTGEGQQVLRAIMERSAKLFATHEINLVRKENGMNPASQVWLWGQGTAPALANFKGRFKVGPAAMITGVDLLRGLARLIGWDNLTMPGMTSFHDTDYARQGVDTAAALDKYDLVVSHIESPDEASHQADTATKIAAIEAIDKHVVGPVLAKLKTYPEWRLLVLPDHPTNIATRKHGYAPTCFAMCGTRVGSVVPKAYTEANAATADLHLDHGHELMEYFLHSAK